MSDQYRFTKKPPYILPPFSPFLSTATHPICVSFHCHFLASIALAYSISFVVVSVEPA